MTIKSRIWFLFCTDLDNISCRPAHVPYIHSPTMNTAKMEEANVPNVDSEATTVHEKESVLDEKVRETSVSPEPSEKNEQLEEANVEAVKSAPEAQAAATGAQLDRIRTSDEDMEYPTGAKMNLISLALCLSVFLMALDNSIIATAIPTNFGLMDTSNIDLNDFLTFDNNVNDLWNVPLDEGAHGESGGFMGDMNWVDQAPGWGNLNSPVADETAVESGEGVNGEDKPTIFGVQVLEGMA